MLKPLRIQDQTTCVTPIDPAIDSDASDWAGYHRDMIRRPSSWREYLKFKDGESPTEFVVGVIPTEHVVRIADECKVGGLPSIGEPKSEEMAWRSFLHSVRDIKPWPEEIPRKKVNDVEYVDPEWLRKTFIRGLRHAAIHVGLVAWAFNSISEDDVKNS